MAVNKKTFSVGDEFEMPGVPGLFKILPNSAQGYEEKYDELPNNGLIILPERLIFTRYNVDAYKF